MSSDTIDTMIGHAWRFEREGQADTAIAEFERILKIDANNIDANYGMGMAQKRAGKNAIASQHFQKALELVEQAADKRRTTRGANEAMTNEDDRYMMLSRMIKQRLSEL